MKRALLPGWKDPLAWCAAGLVIGGIWLEQPLLDPVYHWAANAMAIRHAAPNTLGQGRYGLQMLFRLGWTLLLWVGTCLLLRRRVWSAPLRAHRWAKFLGIGLATGLFVMLAAIACIVVAKSAAITSTQQSVAEALRNGSAWLVLDFLGALGEELLGRAVILLVAQRFLGWRGAIFLSGVMFSGLHLGNPGVSRLWLLRLFLQGMVLAYAVYRTQSVWWAAGYHTGWNWISAPLFGAAGSGYTDEGHMFNFFPTGPALVTGGTVGPEGSVFAFLAVLAALCLLVRATPGMKAQRLAS